MKKNNWIIAAVLVAASIFFLWLWYALQLNLVDNPTDLLLTVMWWLAVAAICVGIHFAEQKRQQRIRTCYVSIAPASVFNSEDGLVNLEEGQQHVDIMQRILMGLKYGFDTKDFPKKSDVSFCALVRTTKFEAGDSASDSPKTWEGEVQDVAESGKDPLSFKNKDELVTALSQVLPSEVAAGEGADAAVVAEQAGLGQTAAPGDMSTPGQAVAPGDTAAPSAQGSTQV